MTDTSARASRRSGVATLLVVAGVLVALATAPGAAAVSPQGCEMRTNNEYHKLLNCVTLEGVRTHQAAFQAIADANGGTRAAATPGYEASVDYVVDTLEDAGWSVDIHLFDFTVAEPIKQLTPIAAEYPTGAFTGSSLGTVTGTVIPVDINLVPPRASTSGCEAADFAGLDFSGPNDIALIQRGTCTFAAKALNAEAAGAEAVIIFNQGNTPAREGLIVGTLAPSSVAIPVVGASFNQGAALAQPGSTATLSVVNKPQKNVIAELEGRNDDNVVMAGGHLDSVEEGPGINDNGSGTAALLETAVMLGKLKPENTLRFAWWGAEESGLIGSQAYVDDLSAAERDRIALYMNYDMVGSPNYVFMVYDADQSTFPAPAGVPIPDGSAAIEDVYESYYTLVDEPYDDTEFSGRSDYEAFIFAGIPSSGLFTGAEEIKTAEQQAIWGGTAGVQFDPCYHLACDTYANNSDHALDVNSDLIAFAALTFAYSTESVNGVPGKNIPGGVKLPAPNGSEGTFEP